MEDKAMSAKMQKITNGMMKNMGKMPMMKPPKEMPPKKMPMKKMKSGGY